MEKQTAVMKLLQYILVDCRNKDGVIQFSAHETFNEYLEMEKQQIVEFTENYILECVTCSYDGVPNPLKEAEEYYNEAFGGKDEQ